MNSSRYMRGYIEGFYGRLLSWQDRHAILDQLNQLEMNCYFYAPKEDPNHRLLWRQDWDENWCNAMSGFCEQAGANKIDVIVGIAPGLDYDFFNEDKEFTILVEKSQQLEKAGVSAIVLMFDDIEPAPDHFARLGRSEAECHANTARRLSEALTVPVYLVPRIYADEIADNASLYYQELAALLPAGMPLFHCGQHIVAGADPLQPETELVAQAGFARLVLWDNHYCNDYCPRRLFVGPHRGRTQNAELLLNGTGMPETDRLLLALMHVGDDERQWQAALTAADVPEAFLTISHWFDAPVLTGQLPPPLPLPDDREMAAIEDLLWRWKSPLAREWYPFLFGLKHDALLASGQMPRERIAKTQTAPLFHYLDRLS